MGQRFQNASFEHEAYWTLGEKARYSTISPRTGLRSMELRSYEAMFGGVSNSQVWGRSAFLLGESVQVKAWATIEGSSLDRMLTLFAQQREAPSGSWVQLPNTFGFGNDAPLAQYDFGSFEATAGVHDIRFLTDLTAAGPPSLQSGSAFLDDVEAIGPDAELLMARSNMATWLANLKAEIEALDPQIGTVFLAERRWSSSSDLIEDGGVVTLNAAGLFDVEANLGQEATRFWILEPWVVTKPLSNATDELRGNVRIVGFWGWKEDESQAGALRDAAVEIVDHLGLKATELDDLGVGMGTGYNGYLTERPFMEGPPRAAQLQTGAQGHVVQISASYFEEVSR